MCKIRLIHISIKALLIHGFSPNSMILGTVAPIPQGSFSEVS